MISKWPVFQYPWGKAPIFRGLKTGWPIKYQVLLQVSFPAVRHVVDTIRVMRREQAENLWTLDEWRKVPRGIRRNLKFRRAICREWRRRSNDKRAQERFERTMVDLCSKDLLFWVNSFVWQYNPKRLRTSAKRVPFIAWSGYQAEALRTYLWCILNGKDLVVEKSRDMGASWLALIVFVWLWLFHPGYAFLLISRTEALVDKPADPDSLFFKVDYIVDRLPDWMLPKGFHRQKNRRSMGLENPRMVCGIDGTASSKAASVGGRRAAILFDEFSRMENADDILRGTADVTDCRIFTFTPWGTNNAAYELAKRPDIKKLRFHWTSHPHKSAGLYQYRQLDDQGQPFNRVMPLDPTYEYPEDFHFVMDGKLRSPWYDAECERRKDKIDIAMNLDIDYQGATYQPFDKTEITHLVSQNCYPAVWRGEIVGNDAGKCESVAKMDGGPLRFWFSLDLDGQPPKGTYAVGCDLATGDGASNSVASVVNCRTGEKVAELCTNTVGAKAFAWLVTALCDFFCDYEGRGAKLCWETQGPGTTFGKEVVKIGYGNIYYKKNDLTGKEYTDPGWYPNTDTRRHLLTNYRTALYSGAFCNPSEEAMLETLDFVVTTQGVWEHSGVKARKNSNPNDTGDNHGDRVIADALAWKMADEMNMLVSVQSVLKMEKMADDPPVLSPAWLHKQERRERRNEIYW
jgi:hypothetical protein